MLQEPYPTLQEIITHIGEAGERLAEIDACEGAAGNISVFMGWDVDPTPLFPVAETIDLPAPAPELAGFGFLATGSGRRLREIGVSPEQNLAFVRVEKGGRTGTQYTSPDRLFARLTSEINSHLAVHRDRIASTGGNFQALVHAQPLHLVYLSNIARYQDYLYFNRHVLRWQPECIANIPDGIGVVPFIVPGSSELMEANIRAMRDHHMVLWSKHGVMVRSDSSVKKACDLIEYAETSARYECLNLTNLGLGDGLTLSEIHAVCEANGIVQRIFE
jgi:rhamnulose-1-phosphate aldolase